MEPGRRKGRKGGGNKNTDAGTSKLQDLCIHSELTCSVKITLFRNDSLFLSD